MKKLTLVEFDYELQKLAERGLDSDLAPKFIAGSLSMMEHELANFHIAIKKEKEVQQMAGAIVSPNGEKVNTN